MTQERVSIGEMARRLGVAVVTLRRWDREGNMSDEDKKEFMVVSNQAKEMADNIFAAQNLSPIADRKNVLANRMVNIRRIFSEDSAEAPSVSAPAERVLLTPPF